MTDSLPKLSYMTFCNIYRVKDVFLSSLKDPSWLDFYENLRLNLPLQSKRYERSPKSRMTRSLLLIYLFKNRRYTIWLGVTIKMTWNFLKNNRSIFGSWKNRFSLIFLYTYRRPTANYLRPYQSSTRICERLLVLLKD